MKGRKDGKSYILWIPEEKKVANHYIINPMLNTKTLMTISAVFLGIGGVLLSFLPQETLHLIGKEDDLGTLENKFVELSKKSLLNFLIK